LIDRKPPVSTAEQNQAIRRRDGQPVRRSFDLKMLLCSAEVDRFFVPALRSRQPARAAAVKEA